MARKTSRLADQFDRTGRPGAERLGPRRLSDERRRGVVRFADQIERILVRRPDPVGIAEESEGRRDDCRTDRGETSAGKVLGRVCAIIDQSTPCLATFGPSSAPVRKEHPRDRLSLRDRRRPSAGGRSAGQWDDRDRAKADRREEEVDFVDVLSGDEAAALSRNGNDVAERAHAYHDIAKHDSAEIAARRIESAGKALSESLDSMSCLRFQRY